MPAKHSRKIFVADKTYHTFNRGVDGRAVFADDHDYRTFLYYLKVYLSDPKRLKKEFPNMSFENNLFGKIDLLSFCLLPNHFHLLVHQNTEDAMSKLLRSVSVCYVGYFNHKYKRSGALFQGVYKAVPAETPLEVLNVSRYINLNPIIEKIDDDFKIVRGKKLADALEHPHSSLDYILGKKKAEWIRDDLLLRNLERCPAYQKKSYLEFLKKAEAGGGPITD
jgi:putative transposase